MISAEPQGSVQYTYAGFLEGEEDVRGELMDGEMVLTAYDDTETALISTLPGCSIKLDAVFKD